MSGLNLIPIFMVGLLGGIHCIGMCGGIVSAFSAATPSARRVFPIAVRGNAPSAHNALFTAAYNVGRISSYMVAGAVAGGIVGSARLLAGLSPLQSGAYWLANLMLVAIGLYLMDAWRGVAQLETAGQSIWRRVQPLMRHVLPADTPSKALLLGALWGWLPCGMVYSVLMTAMLSGSATSGAMVMLAFGLGTLPALYALGMLGAKARAWSQRRVVRMSGGALIVAFGLLGIFRALHGDGLSHNWSDLFCFGTAV